MRRQWLPPAAEVVCTTEETWQSSGLFSREKLSLSSRVSILKYKNVNINVTVQIDNELYVPIVRGGTYTVSNLGAPFGICAIINPPHSCCWVAEKRVVLGSGPEQFKFASFMSVTLSRDHHVIDGAIGAEWLKAFKGYIENPESMLL
ncbi:hypothetical protein COLO4_30703 [Corchorus olitorius]|uniref:2-oxoacid dehydrogenase acyltransferase catalytic domain-containing protein n=1 Tax=Corchorus olitorius TaxID=93759 RepID=A0A1R3H758_9ROSI|nr:hypothetical protein COLO4_30703 [Corchorus olitorius]